MNPINTQVGSGLGSNQALHNIGIMMENTEFRTFFRQYFNNWDDITILIMCMKLYDMVDQYYNKKDQKLESNEIVEIVKNAIKNTNIRKILVNHMTNFTKGVESGFSQSLSEIENINQQLILNKTHHISK
jgi:hypothetical protein